MSTSLPIPISFWLGTYFFDLDRLPYLPSTLLFLHLQTPLSFILRSTLHLHTYSSALLDYNMYLTRARNSRYSMPANGMKSQQRSSVPTHSGLGPLNTTSFLFDDNDDQRLSAGSQGGVTSPNATSFLQMTPVDDNFPTLRSDRTSGIVGCLQSHYGSLC
jgi:hypothetical protein